MRWVGGVAAGDNSLQPRRVGGAEDGTHVEGRPQIVQYQCDGKLRPPVVLVKGDVEVAAALGVVWIIGRFVYFRGYVEDAPRRAPGVLISILCNAVLLLGGAIGALVSWL